MPDQWRVSRVSAGPDEGGDGDAEGVGDGFDVVDRRAGGTGQDALHGGEGRKTKSVFDNNKSGALPFGA